MNPTTTNFSLGSPTPVTPSFLGPAPAMSLGSTPTTSLPVPAVPSVVAASQPTSLSTSVPKTVIIPPVPKITSTVPAQAISNPVTTISTPPVQKQSSSTFTTPSGAVVDVYGNTLSNPSQITTSNTADNNYAAIVQGITQNLSNSQQQNQDIQNRQDEITTNLKDRYTQLLGKTAFQQQQENILGIPQLQKDIQELTTQINSIGNETQAQQLALQNASIGRGVTAGGLQPQEDAIARNNAVKALSLSAQLSAKQGNLAIAQQQVTRAVDLQYAPIEQDIKAKLQLIDINKDTLTASQKKIADATAQQLQAQLSQVAAQKDVSSQVGQLIITASQNQAPNNVLADAQKQSSVAGAAQALSGYLGKNTDIVNANGRQILINKNTGQKISDLGASPLNAFSYAGTTGGQALIQAINNGQIAPSDVSSRNASLLGTLFAQNPNFNANSANAAQKFYESNGTQQTFARIASINNSLDDLLKASKDVPRSEFPLVNKAIITGNIQGGSPKAIAFVNIASRVGPELAQLLGGGESSDFRTKLAAALVDPSLSDAQLRAAVEAEKGLLSNLNTAFKTQSGQSTQGASIKIGGNEYVVGQVYTNSKGQKGLINADGTITPQ